MKQMKKVNILIVVSHCEERLGWIPDTSEKITLIKISRSTANGTKKSRDFCNWGNSLPMWADAIIHRGVLNQGTHSVLMTKTDEETKKFVSVESECFWTEQRSRQGKWNIGNGKDGLQQP